MREVLGTVGVELGGVPVGVVTLAISLSGSSFYLLTSLDWRYSCCSHERVPGRTLLHESCISHSSAGVGRGCENILAVPMSECLGEHFCTSPAFPIALLG